MGILVLYIYTGFKKLMYLLEYLHLILNIFPALLMSLSDYFFYQYSIDFCTFNDCVLFSELLKISFINFSYGDVCKDHWYHG